MTKRDRQTWAEAEVGNGTVAKLREREAALHAEKMNLQVSLDAARSMFRQLQIDHDRLRERIEERERELTNRDDEWSAALETGHCDVPPRTPNDVLDWWRRHFASVEFSSKAAAEERLHGELSRGINGLEIRQRIMDCDEIIGPEGHCACSRWISARIAEATQEADSAVAECTHSLNNGDIPATVQDTINDLRAQIAEAQRDSERLDWMESLRGDWCGWIVRIETEPHCGNTERYLDLQLGMNENLPKTLRAAIDAARASGDEPCERCSKPLDQHPTTGCFGEPREERDA